MQISWLQLSVRYAWDFIRAFYPLAQPYQRLKTKNQRCISEYAGSSSILFLWD